MLPKDKKRPDAAEALPRSDPLQSRVISVAHTRRAVLQASRPVGVETGETGSREDRAFTVRDAGALTTLAGMQVALTEGDDKMIRWVPPTTELCSSVGGATRILSRRLHFAMPVESSCLEGGRVV